MQIFIYYFTIYAFFLNKSTVDFISSLLNIAEPATIILAPALTTLSTFSGFIPPSTCISTFKPLAIYKIF